MAAEGQSVHVEPVGEGGAPASADGAASVPVSDERGREWGRIWQVPLAIAGLAAFSAGVAHLVISRPEPDVPRLLSAAEDLILRDQAPESLHLLNTLVAPHLGAAETTDEVRGRFHLIRARALAHAQEKLHAGSEENHARIVNEFTDAERWGAELTPDDVSILAGSLIAMDRFAAALRRAALLSGSEQDRATRILRRVVQARLADGGTGRSGEILTLLREMLERESLGERDRAWATARQAELLMREGDPEGAIARILRTAPLLEEGAGLGELLVVLSRAYMEVGATDEAEANATRALSFLAPNEPLGGEAQLVLAGVEAQRGHIREAHERYAAVVDQFPGQVLGLRARLGVAETAAALGEDEASLAAYERLVDRAGSVEAEAGGVEPGREAIVRSLLARFGDRISSGHVDSAIAYAQLGERLSGIEGSPPELLRALGEGHRRRALGVIGDLGRGLDRLLGLAELEPSVRERARRDLMSAGSYYRLYAERVLLSDTEAYADALWLSADSFDRAGDRRRALEGYGEFGRQVLDDPRRPEARFRQAQAMQAIGDYAGAASIYESLIEAGERGAGKGVGAFANLSYVPLARSYLLDGEASNDEEAERLLRHVVSGRVGTAEAPFFADALIELGEYLFDQGRYPEAIERLEEALARYPAHPRLDAMQYKLAEAHRLEATSISATLGAAAPESDRRALERARVEHLHRAIDLYSDAIETLAGRAREEWSALQRMRARNARFYRGACAFDLGDFALARRYYEDAREAYPQDPSSLVSLVQVVNTYVAEGNWAAARTAQERARRFYTGLPDEVWDDPSLPLRREDWERWLASTADLTVLARAEGGGS